MPLTAKEKRQIKHIYYSERKKGYGKKRSKRIAYAKVYSLKRKHESM